MRVPNKFPFRIMVHGGFVGESSSDEKTTLKKKKALEQYVTEGFEMLKSHPAPEVVSQTVVKLENDPLFNAGTGSRVQSDGIIRMSASVMDGSKEHFAGVINLEAVKNPVLVAMKLLEEEDKVLEGQGALLYARKKGFLPYDPMTQMRKQEHQEKTRTGTVGCVALDRFGHLAAATSTGGKGSEIPGRVSDSATVAGNYAGKYCAVSCTGIGEDIVGAALAAKISTRVSDGMTLAMAFKKSFAELKEQDGFAGAIGLDHAGNSFHLDSHPTMAFASYDGTLLEVFQ